mgnify:CR=1 FL=1
MNKYERPIFEDLRKMEDPKEIISLFKEAGFKIPKDNYNEIIVTQREFWFDSIMNVIGKKYLFQIDENNFYDAFRPERLHPWDEWALRIKDIASSYKKRCFSKTLFIFIQIRCSLIFLGCERK